mgnify:FL=1
MQDIKKRNSIKKQRIPKRSEEQQIRAKKRSGKLYKLLNEEKNRCILMDDETDVKMNTSTLPGPQFYNVIKGQVVNDKMKKIQVDKFGKKVLVWQAICSCGLKSSSFFTFGTIKGEDCRKECIQKHLLPPLFWPDLASAHYANATLEFLTRKNIKFVVKEDNPPNCPELRPVERYWALVKKHLKKDGREAKTLEEFRKIWMTAARKVTENGVRRLMESIKSKVRKFYRS